MGKLLVGTVAAAAASAVVGRCVLLRCAMPLYDLLLDPCSDRKFG